jgi:hypothetical protein
MSTRATAAERAQVLPGDDLVQPAAPGSTAAARTPRSSTTSCVVMDRAFSLDAPPAAVWPWLVQLGKGRAGWYLPAPLERAIPRSRRGLRHLEPRFLGLQVGDVIPDWGGKDATFTVEELAPADHLLFSSTRGHTRLTWCLQLRPEGLSGTRVHLRLRLAPVRHRLLAERVGGAFDQATISGLAAGLRERVTYPEATS